MEPTASSLSRIPDTTDLRVPDESIVQSLRERLGVKEVKAPPLGIARANGIANRAARLSLSSGQASSTGAKMNYSFLAGLFAALRQR